MMMLLLCCAFVFVVVAVHASEQSSIVETLSGKPMNPITLCPNINNTPIRPENIHIIISSTPNRAEKSLHYTETVKYYASLHGYHFKVIDPSEIIVKHFPTFNKLFKMLPTAVLNLKSLISLYHMKELFHTFGCEAKWMVVLDADVMVTNFPRRLESIIEYANSMLGSRLDSGLGSVMVRKSSDAKSSGCQVIGQLGPATVNAGVLFFQVSPAGQQILERWLNTTVIQASNAIEWQVDQGRLQTVYLDHLRDNLNISLPLDCTYSLRKLLDSANNPRMLGVNAFRNVCFARNLYTAGLLPPTQPTGDFCMLPPLTDVATFNLRDYEKVEVIHNGEYVISPLLYDTAGQEVPTEKCDVKSPLFLHSNEPVITNAVYHTFQKLKQALGERNANDIPLKSWDKLPFKEPLLGFNPTTVVSTVGVSSQVIPTTHALYPHWGQYKDHPLSTCSALMLRKMQSIGSTDFYMSEEWKQLTARARHKHW